MIKAHIVDAEALGSRSPVELASYLRGRGWRIADHTDAVARWLLDTEEGEAEILQPRQRSLRDYVSRMAEAVTLLAAIEGRSELEIIRDITASTWDVHTVRVIPPDAPPGLIQIDEGLTAYESLRALVNAAAYPVFAGQERAVQPARKPQGLLDFMRTVRIGTATEGSFVLTAHVPVPIRLSEQPPLSEDFATEADEPAERRVSLRMHEAISAAHDAADAALVAADGLEPFAAAVARGVSANLCEALAGLAGAEGNRFEFSVALAPARRGKLRYRPIEVGPEHLAVLRAAASELRARVPEEDVVVRGDVVRLHREGNGRGEITIIGRIDDPDALQRVWVSLSAEDYESAVMAHQSTRQVTARGNVIRNGNRRYLHGATGFRVLADRDSADDGS